MFRRTGLVLTRFTAILLIALPSAQPLLAAPQPKGAPWVGKQLSGQPCEGYQENTGPFDYLKRKDHVGDLRVVEQYHFTPQVEALERGMSDTVMGELDYVLKIFPNHHRALNSVMTFSLRHKNHPAGEKGLPAECYFQRALNFSPNDGTTYKLYGYYLHRKGKYQEALEANEEAMRLRPTDVMLQYNTGLILVKLKRYKQAMKLARPLYDAGLTLPGLKRQLQAAGHWEANEEELAAYREKMKEAIEEKAAAKDTEDSPSPEAETPDTAEVAVPAVDEPAAATRDDSEPDADDPAVTTQESSEPAGDKPAVATQEGSEPAGDEPAVATEGDRESAGESPPGE